MRLFFLFISFFISASSLYSQNKKVFFCTGAVSGDNLSAWYVKKLRLEFPTLYAEGIGGQSLEREGVDLLHHFNDIQASHLTSASGFFSRLFSIPSMLSSVDKIAQYVDEARFTDLVLVDFPFFNIPLARAVKKLNTDIKITYVALPELWFWRSWGIDYLLRWYCDRIIVLYPFEKAWYKENLGLETEWVGYPFYDELHQYVQKSVTKNHQVALIPGSRSYEVKTFMPLLAAFAAMFSQQYPDVRFVLPLAETISQEDIVMELKKHHVENLVTIITHEHEKRQALSLSCFAVSKPGTITLELALLRVPSIVMCRVGWITYWMSKLIVPQKYVSLPNIFLDTETFKEFFQSQCTVKNLMVEAEKLYQSFVYKEAFYDQKINDLAWLDAQFQIDGDA